LLGSYSRPLHCERVNLRRADVSGEYRRAIRGNAKLGISARTNGKEHTLQASDRFHLVIGQSNAKSHWLRAASGVVDVLVVRRMFHVYQVARHCRRHQVGPFLRSGVENHELLTVFRDRDQQVIGNPSYDIEILRPGNDGAFSRTQIEELDVAICWVAAIYEDQATPVRGPSCTAGVRLHEGLRCDPPSILIKQVVPAELVYATCLPSGEMEG
jgi:hypothetical protein